MQQLNSLYLPEKMPTAEAIKSWKQTVHDYEPEIWEFQYETYRYLKNINNDKLIERYKNIHRNYQALTGIERDVIPINSSLSSWYWCRKEHQTRYEFFLRGLLPPVSPPKPRPPVISPYRSKRPNACDVLFRYGDHEYMTLFTEKGKIRISPALKYKDGLSQDPKTDDELNKHQWLLGEKVKIKTLDGRKLPIIGDLKRTTSIPNYYTLCLSCDFEPLIFEEFKYDSCVIIKNPTLFAERLEASLKDILPGWYFVHVPIQYFDPHEPIKNGLFNAPLCKDFSYAYQMEYRFVWDPFNNGSAKDHIDITLGSLVDICELYKLN